MDLSYNLRLVRDIDRLESSVPNLRFFSEQCKAMVLGFVHVRDVLLIETNGESAAIFEELLPRLTREAERVLTICCCEQWLQAAILQDNILEIIQEDLHIIREDLNVIREDLYRYLPDDQDSSYYVRLVRAMYRLVRNEPNLKFYREQGKAMVLEFVHVRRSLLIGTNGESAAIFIELFRLTCAAERVLANCCCEQWLQAAILQDDGSIKSIREDLNRCLDILFETNYSSTKGRAQQGPFDPFELDQVYLRDQLNEKLTDRTGTVPLRDKLIARFLLARLNNKEGERVFDGLGNVVWINRQGGHILGGPGSSDISTVAEIKWLGVSLAEKSFNIHLGSACCNEASIMAKLNHPNVVRFISCSIEERQRPAIIMELEETTLERYLQNRRGQDVQDQRRMSQRALDNGEGPSFDLVVPLPVAVDIMEQISLGMAYLHSENVAYLDLKPANVLVTSCTEHEFLRVKIADFGLSMRGVRGKLRNTFPNLGTTFYRAPEIFEEDRMVCMKAADVYCFGLTCWEILHCQVPRLMMKTPISCLDVLHCKGPELELVKTTQPFYYRELIKGRRLDINPAIPPQLRDLIRACWQTNPNNRPPFSTICFFFESYKASLLGSQLQLPVDVFPLVQQQRRSMFRQLCKAAKNLMVRILPSSQNFSNSRQDEENVFEEDRV